MKIAIFGSATSIVSKENKLLCKKVGKYLAQKKITVVTGGSHGIPGLVVLSAFKAGAKTEAYSPDKNRKEHHLRNDNLPLKYFKKTKFIPGFTARSLAMIKDVDGVLVLNGRIGTLSEFTIALEEGSDISVLKNSGGIADHLEYIVSVAKKEFPNKVIFEVDYKKAIDDLIDLINQNSKRRVIANTEKEK
jgi:uncharacterized protein (TIGR00725 family)